MVSPLRQQIHAVPSLLWRSVSLRLWRISSLYRDVVHEKSASRSWMYLDDVVAHCPQSLATYKVPRRIEFLDTALPESGSGKILKRILRERFWAHQERVVS